MSSYIDDATFLVRVPAVATTPTGLTSDQWTTLRGIALSDAQAEIALEDFGNRAPRAHAMLAAHMLAIDGWIAGGGSGVVSAHAAGAISASYATGPGPSDPLLATTKYGREFLRIRNGLVSVPEVG